MLDTANSNDPTLRREFSKTFTAFSTRPEVRPHPRLCSQTHRRHHAQLFTSRQREHLDVLGVWAVFRATLATDDSFAFNKAVKQLRACIEALPVAEEHEDAALATAQAGLGANESPLLVAALLPQVERNGVDDDETAWDEAQAQAARRQALLDCILAAKAQYVHVRPALYLPLLYTTRLYLCRHGRTPRWTCWCSTWYTSCPIASRHSSNRCCRTSRRLCRSSALPGALARAPSPRGTARRPLKRHARRGAVQR